MPLIAEYIKTLLLGTLIVLAQSCSEKKAQYIPSEQPDRSEEEAAFTLALTDEGALKITWTGESDPFDVYYTKETIQGSALNFSTEASSETIPFLYEVIGRSKLRAPMSVGAKLGTTTGNEFRFDLALDTVHYFLIQFVTKSAAEKEKNFPVYLLKLELAPSAEATAVLDADKKASVSWNPVPAAKAYDVLAEDGTVLGSTTETSLVLEDIRAHYYVRAKRGGLVWSQRTKATLNASPVSIASIEVEASGGIQTIGSTLTFKARFSEAVTVGASSALPLQLDGKTVDALYHSGTGTAEVLYKYTVVSGDNTSALTLPGPITGQVLDSQALPLTKALPDASAIFANTGAVKIDTAIPGNVSSIAASTASSLDGTASVSWTPSVDANLAKYRFKLCLDTACSLNCESSQESTAPTINLTTIPDGTYYSCVQAVDAVDLASSYTASMQSLLVDSDPPTVVALTAMDANGTYGIGGVISIAIQFTEDILITGTPSLALNSGGSAVYASGSGSDTLTFTYTVGAGDDAGDLDQAGTGALTTGGGTLRDEAGNPAVLTLPAGGDNNTIGELKDIVVDT